MMKVLPHDLSLPYTISKRNGQFFILITCFTAKRRLSNLLEY